MLIQRLKQNKILLILMAILTFLSMFVIFMQPVNAACSCDIKPKYVTINCSICNSNHKVTRQDYERYYKDPCTNPGKAKIDCQLCGQKHCRLVIEESGVKNLAYKLAVGANSDFASYKSILNSEESTLSLFKILQFDSSTYGTQLGQIRGIHAVLVNIGLLIIAIYFILELGEASLDDTMTYEHLIFMAIKAFISIIVITNAMDWISMGLDTMSQIFSSISTTLSGNNVYVYSVGDCTFDRIKEAGDLAVMGELITDAVYCVVIMITYLVVYVVCWARIFDIFVRIVFAPIGMADFMHGGVNCLAVRYFKKLLSSVMQGACIMGVLLSYRTISSAIRGGLTGPVIGIILGFAVITVVTQTQQIANDAIGE